jgi:poly(hydroxyalkanoate) depolymerase family esterase
VLHGCTQSAADYDRGSGWSRLADSAGFALLFPEQQRANNANLCFNWFQANDTASGRGEAQSIIAMIDTLLARHGLDPARVFITGLSAGGAMAMALLATHPGRFAGGGIIAGLPYGVASGIPDAFERMRGQGLPPPPRLAALVPAHKGRWPRLSVWHGDADTTVAPLNAEAIIAQWLGAQHLPLAPTSTTTLNGARLRRWGNNLEAVTIPGLGHGTPIATTGTEALGHPAPFMLDCGLSSTRRIAAFWGIAPAVADGVASPRPAAASPLTGVAATIDAALRRAGLLG